MIQCTISPDTTGKRFACVAAVQLPEAFPGRSPSFVLRAVGNGDLIHRVEGIRNFSASWNADTLATECHAFLWEQVCHGLSQWVDGGLW